MKALHGSAWDASLGAINLAWDSVYIFDFLRFGGVFDTTLFGREVPVVHSYNLKQKYISEAVCWSCRLIFLLIC